MVEKILTVKNRAGIHARPAAIIAQTANKFACEVTLSRDDSASIIIGKLRPGLTGISI